MAIGYIKKALKTIAIYLILPGVVILSWIPISFILSFIGYILTALIMLWPITMLSIFIYEKITGKKVYY